MKLLREYQSIANINHFCDCCARYIQPGEQYKGQVYVTKNNGIIVSKQHENPVCDFPYDEEELLNSSQSKTLESSIKENVSSNLAA